MTYVAVPEGDVPNYEKAFGARPEVYARWQALNGAIKAGMELRRYELSTLAAARELRSSYCMIAHGSGALANDLLDRGALIDIAAGTPPQLDDTDRAVVAFAAKVADDATAVTQDDVDALRTLGLSDADVVDVVLATAARCFFSTVLDALGASADAAFADKLGDPALLAALTVGRPAPSA
jgi:alkylhydroperoxidase family enzyme